MVPGESRVTPELQSGRGRGAGGGSREGEAAREGLGYC